MLVSEGRYSRLFGASDEIEGGEVVLKFPKPQVAAVATYRRHSSARPGSAHTSKVPGSVASSSCRRAGKPASIPSCRCIRVSCWRRGLRAAGARPGGGSQHRHQAGARRVGVAPRRHHPSRHQARQRDTRRRRVAQADRSRRGARSRARGFPAREYSRHHAYMAPEMFSGDPGNVATDMYALGVTMFRSFTGEFPYGNLDGSARRAANGRSRSPSCGRTCPHGCRMPGARHRR